MYEGQTDECSAPDEALAAADEGPGYYTRTGNWSADSWPPIRWHHLRVSSTRNAAQIAAERGQCHCNWRAEAGLEILEHCAGAKIHRSAERINYTVILVVLICVITTEGHRTRWVTKLVEAGAMSRISRACGI